MPFTEANGQRLYYEVHGEGDPLLCVHGLAVDTLGWALQVPTWSQAYRTIVFDNRDVGQSSYATEPYEISDMARDALAVADALELDTFHLLGVSMGGAIAQELALLAPERVRTLTLCVTFGGSGRYGAELSRVWGADAMRISHEEHIDGLLLRTMSEQFFDDPEQVRFLRTMMLSNPHPQAPEGFARQLDAAGRHETRDRVGQLSMPVHVIGAEWDLLVPVWKSKELAELIPGAEYTVIPRAPHAIQIERAEEFNKIVLDFLGARSAAAA